MKQLVAIVLAGCGAHGGPVANHAHVVDPHASRDDMVRATFAALSAGDHEQLLALAAVMEVAERSLDCEQHADVGALFGDALPDRERLAHAASEARGVAIDVVGVASDETLFRTWRPSSGGRRFESSVRAGEEVGACTAKLDVLVHAMRVNVRVPNGECSVPLALLEVGGRWYLSDVATPTSELAVGDETVACFERITQR